LRLSGDGEERKTDLLVPRLSLLAADKLVSIPVLLLMFYERIKRPNQGPEETRRSGRDEGLTTATVTN